MTEQDPSEFARLAEGLSRGGFVVSYPPFESLDRGACSDAWEQAPFSLYVHLPYCRKRCTFCFYRVYTNRAALPMEAYLQALFGELNRYGEDVALHRRRVGALYFGGGTPTTLSTVQLRELNAVIRRNFDIPDDVEFTCEAEPGTLDESKIACLRDIGVTRLSLGVQSFDAGILTKNGRSHGVEQALQSIRLARHAGFPVINVDLMSGMVDETAGTWRRTLDTVVDLQAEHVSIYRMEVYKNTLLYTAGYTGPGVGGIPTDSEELALWMQAVETLEAAGYTQLTGHAFARRPEHRHTQIAHLWTRAGEMLGTGVSAYSFYNGCLFQNTADWDEYVSRSARGESAIGRGRRLTSRERMARDMVLGLKFLRLDRRIFRARHGFDPSDLYPTELSWLERRGLLEVTDDVLALTRLARPFVETICSLFYLPHHADQRFARFANDEQLASSELANVVGTRPR
jgi:putative oxygen-independent coproporphyrinogen III oxidase